MCIHVGVHIEYVNTVQAIILVVGIGTWVVTEGDSISNATQCWFKILNIESGGNGHEAMLPEERVTLSTSHHCKTQSILWYLDIVMRTFELNGVCVSSVSDSSKILTESTIL